MTQLEVWIEGSPLPDCDPERAAADFARLAKISPEQARALLASGKARLVKRCDAATAEALVNRLTDIGVAAECRVPENAETPKPERQPADTPQWLRWILKTLLYLGKCFDALLGQIIDPPEKKTVALTGTGKWRDTPKIVPFSHGFRWHLDPYQRLHGEIDTVTPVIIVLGIFTYGMLNLYGLCCLVVKSVPLGTPFPVVMGLIPPFWGFCYARGIQAAQQGNTAWLEELCADLTSWAYLLPLLTLSLCLGLLWHCLPFPDALRRYPAAFTISPGMICSFSGGIILFLTGQFLATALAVTPNTGLTGLGRICLASVRNWRAFLACGLPIPPFFVCIGVTVLLYLGTQMFGGASSRKDNRLIYGLFIFGTVFAQIHLMEVVYFAARDIFYDEEPEAPAAGNA